MGITLIIFHAYTDFHTDFSSQNSILQKIKDFFEQYHIVYNTLK